MRAVTWQGRRQVRVEQVPDPRLQDPTDAIIQIDSTGLCGSDLHLYETLGPFLHPGDVLGHEPLGRVVEKGSAVPDLQIGDRVVVPFQIACGRCFMCERDLQTQCETTQVRQHAMGAALFGYTDLYGAVPGAQAEYLRVPHADYGPITVDERLSDDRCFLLADVVPTAWQAVEYADVGADETLLILGLGPIGEMAARVALLRGIRVLGVDRVPERLARCAARGVEVVDLREFDPVEVVPQLTSGRGADAVVDAVGMEAHGSPLAELAQRGAGRLPDRLARPLMTRVSVDRMSALRTALDTVRRGGTISISGVYAGAMDPVSLQRLFDKQITVRAGQANVRRWMADLMPVASEAADPLGLDDFVTHRLPLDAAPRAYEMFQHKEDGAIKVVFEP